jgi:hypothetical protein
LITSPIERIIHNGMAGERLRYIVEIMTAKKKKDSIIKRKK